MFPSFFNPVCGMDFLGGKMTKKKRAKCDNENEVRRFFIKFYNMFINEFEWTGDIPETVDTRHLEHCLLMTGAAALFKTDEGGFMCLQASPSGLLNPYGEPLEAWVTGMNGYNKKVTLYTPGAETIRVLRDGKSSPFAYNGVLCRDNRAAYPLAEYLRATAIRCANAIRACDVAVENLKVPYILGVPEKQVNTVKEIIMQREENIPVIIGNDALSINELNVMTTSTQPETLKAFLEYEEETENKLLEMCGLNVEAVSRKKERLLVDEVNANNEEISLYSEMRLAERKLFCERIEKAFGLKWDVKRRELSELVDEFNGDATNAGGLSEDSE